MSLLLLAIFLFVIPVLFVRSRVICRALCSACMALLPLYAQVMYHYPLVGISNVSNVLYAATIHSFLLVVLIQGADYGRYLVKAVLVAMSISVVIAIAVSVIDTPYPKNQPYHDAVGLLHSVSFRVIMASFLAFACVAMWILFLPWDGIKWYPLLAVGAQVIDSITFFPPAFAYTNVPVIEAMLTGAAIKISLHLAIGWPFIYFAAHLNSIDGRWREKNWQNF